MKRIFAGLGMTALLLCAGCTVQSLPGETANRMAGGFSADVTVTNADSETKATLTRMGMNAWSILFSEPKQLAGVQLDFLDDEVKASYKGLEFSVPQSAQALRTELGSLMEVVDGMALEPELNGHTEEGNVICEGELEVGEYTLTCSDEGIPLSFLFPAYGVVVTFDSFTEESTSLPAETTAPLMETRPEAVPTECTEPTT